MLEALCALNARLITISHLFQLVTVADPGFEVRGAHFLGIRFAPPLERLSWSHYKSLYLDFLGFRIAPPPPCVFFLWSHYKSVYLVCFFCSHYKSLYLDFLRFRIAPPPCVFFLWSHYKSIYLEILFDATIKVYTWIS